MYQVIKYIGKSNFAGILSTICKILYGDDFFLMSEVQGFLICGAKKKAEVSSFLLNLHCFVTQSISIWK